MPADLVMGLDASTTACKSIVWDRQGNAIAEGRAPLPLLAPRPGWHEQPAECWWQAAAQSMRQAAGQINPRRLAALCIAPQRESFVPVDAGGQPLRNGILWMDERAQPLLPVLGAALGLEAFHRITGKPLSVNLTIAKIAWLRQFEPDVYAQTAFYLDVHAFLVQRLTGLFRTGWGCADPTGLFDMHTHTWSTPCLEAVGLCPEQVPEAFPPGVRMGAVLPAPAADCGLPPGLPVAAGIGDGQSCGLGTAILQPGQAYLGLGTSVVSGAFSDRFVTGRAFRTLYGGIPGSYLLETALMGGGYTLNWFLEKIVPQPGVHIYQLYDQYEQAAAGIPPGCDGLMLVPYWNSVLGPYWDASASGIVVGWRGLHQPAHFYRAILEGIAYEQRLCTTGVEAAMGTTIDRFIVVGGGARSGLWRQIIADVTGKPVYRAATHETAALGAGILAASTAGLHPDIPQAARAMSRLHPDPAIPDPARHAFYSRLYEDVYRHLYPALQPYLSKL
jgi:sugar (pentulose or hexulose) kinase